MKAIILAAGMGTRLKSIGATIPKCLLKIGDKTLLEYTLDNLKQNNINEVLIVVGHLKDLIKEKIGNSYKGMNIKYIENKEYSTTGHAYSLFQTKNLLDDDALLIEGDLLCESNAIKFTLEHPGKNLILTTPPRSGDEVPIYVDNHNNLTYLKHPLRGKVNQEQDSSVNDKIIGELVGITKFSQNFFNEMFKEIEQTYTEGTKDQHYEEAILKISKSIPVKCFSRNLTWIEIDTEEDLNKAKNIFSKINKKI